MFIRVISIDLRYKTRKFIVECKSFFLALIFNIKQITKIILMNNLIIIEDYGGWYRTSHTVALLPTTGRQNTAQCDRIHCRYLAHFIALCSVLSHYRINAAHCDRAMFSATKRYTVRQWQRFAALSYCAAFCRTDVSEIATVRDVLYQPP